MSSIAEIFGGVTDTIGIKSLADFYVLKNKLKLEQGLAKSQNTINELVAQTELEKAKNPNLIVDPTKPKPTTVLGFDKTKLITYGLLAGGAFLVYKWLK
jgi:hypothetical protein